MPVRLTPAEFTVVKFDADRVRAVAEETAASLGMADEEIELEVIESSPLAFVTLRSIDPLSLEVEGGAIENPRVPRTLFEPSCREVVGRLLLEARDRRDPNFAAPPLGETLPSTKRVSWDTYIVGRLVRQGGRSQEQRRRYHFRVRHGFDDASDATFDRLWRADGLTFADLPG